MGQLTGFTLCKLMAQVPCYSNRKETVYPSCVTILQEACQGDTGGTVLEVVFLHYPFLASVFQMRWEPDLSPAGYI